MKTHEERAAEIAQFVIDNRHSQVYRHNMSSHELFHLIRDKIVEGLKDSEKWVSYSWEDKDSHPPKYGMYWIYRQGCDKQHPEVWNGSGWSSSNNDCTHWMPLPQPPKT